MARQKVELNPKLLADHLVAFNRYRSSGAVSRAAVERELASKVSAKKLKEFGPMLDTIFAET